MAVTRNQVAKEANVSSATVSRVFNNPNSVSQELRDSVLSAAKKLQYVPNKAASQLRRRGTGVIAVVKINKQDRNYYWGSLKLFDWFYAQAQRGMLNAIENTSYQLSFHTINTKKDLNEIENKADGIIGYDIDNEKEEAFFNGLKIPYVLAHHIKPNNNFLHVSTDNEYGGELQGNFLKEKKVVKPLYISGYINQVISHSQRLQGLKKVYPNLFVYEFDFLDNKQLENMIKQLPDIIIDNNCDGLAFVNDLVLVQTIVKLNFDLPIIGYDGAPYVSLINSVASIDFHIDEIYKIALLKVIDSINGKKVKGEKVLPSIIL